MVESAQFRGDFSVQLDVTKTAEIISAGMPVAIDNDLVGALWGDGSQASFRNGVARVKGSEAKKPFGLTIPNGNFLQYVDQDRLDPEVRWLFDYDFPGRLTGRSGAFIFWRLPGRENIKDTLPSTVWSIGQDGLPVVQNWSPEGKSNIQGLLQCAQSQGVEYPAVTSLNHTTQPEITNPHEAEVFAANYGLALLSDKHAKHLMHGSYPVVEVTGNKLSIVRARSHSIGTRLVVRLLDGLPVEYDESDNVKQGWDHPDLKNERGSDLRSALLTERWLGWTATKNI